MDWWQQPYKGGPMVPVSGFPRTLKVGDPDGEDVIAYKRTVSRAGRWPWQEFDDSYSQGFAMGNGPNVINTGVAGLQRQMNIPPNGIIDKAVFNTLRSIRVPEGKPHAGEMAMDVTAQNLLAIAFKRFQAVPTPLPDPAPPPVTKTAAQARLVKAISYLGYVESPAESNHTLFGQWYGLDYQPWCAMFVTYCDAHAKPCPSFRQGERYSYVPYIVNDAYNRRNGLTATTQPEPGDMVCYDWGRDGTFDHVGLFEAWAGTVPSEFHAIEGNTSGSNDSNGGQVMRRIRDTRNQTTVFVHVSEP